MEDILGLFIGLVAVVMIFGIPIVAIWTKHHQKLAELEAGNSAGAVEVLKDRIEVLERIATDKGVHLAAEIEALRGNESAGTQIESRGAVL